MKTAELQGPALDWAVAKALNLPAPYFANGLAPNFSTNWAQGGPIIEREEIAVGPVCDDGSAETSGWAAVMYFEKYVAREFFGPTPLVAAMRCYVASKLGDEIEIPEELK